MQQQRMQKQQTMVMESVLVTPQRYGSSTATRERTE